MHLIQHTQYVTLPFSYIELIVSGLYMLSREPGCARLYHTIMTLALLLRSFIKGCRVGRR